MDFKIDKEFQDLMPVLTTEEMQLLTESLISEGCREPVLVWNGLIVDGCNRFCICDERGVEYLVRAKTFADRAEAKTWIIKNQFGRRNLTASQRGMLAAELANLEKGRPPQPKSQPSNGQAVTVEVRTSAHLSQAQAAAVAGVSRRLVQESKVVLEEGDEKVKQDVRSGKVTVKKASREIREKKRNDAPVASENDLGKEKAKEKPIPGVLVRDEEGVVIRDPEIAALFGRRKEFNALLRHISKIRGMIKRGQEEKDELFVHLSCVTESMLGNNCAWIRCRLPHALCVSCRGRGRKTKDCKCCSGMGWVNKESYEKSARELKAGNGTGGAE